MSQRTADNMTSLATEIVGKSMEDEDVKMVKLLELLEARKAKSLVDGNDANVPEGGSGNSNTIEIMAKNVMKGFELL